MVLWQLHIPFFMFLFTLCVGGVCWHWWVDRYRWFLSRKHIMTVLAFPPYNTNIVKQPLVVQYLIYYIFSIDNHFDEIWNHLKTNKHHGWPVEKHLMVMVKTQQNHCITFDTNTSHGKKITTLQLKNMTIFHLCNPHTVSRQLLNCRGCAYLPIHTQGQTIFERWSQNLNFFCNPRNLVKFLFNFNIQLKTL